MDAYSLLSPPAWLPWYMWPVWPLIFWRIQRLKAWWRAAGRKGSQMLWGVDRWGRVFVIALSDDLSGRKGADAPLPGPSRQLLAAINGDLLLSACPGSRERTPDVRPARLRALACAVPGGAACGPIPDT